jgi:hypothetical protein
MSKRWSKPREKGMSDEEIAAVLHDAAEALLEGLT